MPETEKSIAETMISPETGAVLRRGSRSVTVSYMSESMVVDLPGYYGDGEDDGIHVGDDMNVTDEALKVLRQRVVGFPPPAEIRRIRAKLKLTQREAGQLLKVGENAFDKYERGLIEPSGPTIQLIKLLDRHPELVDELR